MKSLFQILSVLAMGSTLIACDPSKSAKLQQEDLNRQYQEAVKDIDRQIENSKQKLRQSTEMLSKGGMPGAIVLSPALAKEDADQNVIPDSRLQIQQVGGKGADGTLTAVNSKQSLVIESSDSNQAPSPAEGESTETEKNTYINVGCAKLEANEIAGLKLVKMKIKKNALIASAQKVFICSKGKMLQGMTLVSADEVILQDADYSMNLKKGIIFLIQAKVLRLIGKNRFATEAPASEISLVQQGPTIHLSISEKLEGTGSLELSTKGADYLKPAATNTIK